MAEGYPRDLETKNAQAFYVGLLTFMIKNQYLTNANATSSFCENFQWHVGINV